ncbi:MAG: type III restriction endonuclease subunit R [Burkholderiales bacterium]|nr:type III restriction endonuclease subunit R [Burkholderiales bacterium]
MSAALLERADAPAASLNDGQRDSLRALAARLPHHGVIVADEVGMGKTRIATSVAHAVASVGGRVAILVPPGLGYQWAEELRHTGVADVPPLLRSLDAYLNAWADADERAPAPRPWAELPVMLISHAFCNWPIAGNTRNNSKWTLLPQTLARVHALQRASRRLPRGTGANGDFDDVRVTRAAQWIVGHADAGALMRIAARPELQRWGPGSPMLDKGEYGRGRPIRLALEQVVGLGLGAFDLVVIDEAHKSRGALSNLNRLLEHVIGYGRVSRRLAMTATPIELDVEQWKQALGRIQVEPDAAGAAIGAYQTAVERVRRQPQDAHARQAYAAAAHLFETTLGGYLLRRDKREDESVRSFVEHTGEDHNAYRHECEIVVRTGDLTLPWQRAVCAAEALSFVARGLDDHATQRLRLTLGNGHGLAAWIDDAQTTSEPPREGDGEGGQPQASGDGAPEDKRGARVAWWRSRLLAAARSPDAPAADVDAALYDHPAIRAAVREIEAVCAPAPAVAAEKVLVFGRFTRPMQALERLLNARQMLRCLDSGVPWPRRELAVSERPAVAAALRQLGRSETLAEIQQRLREQYNALRAEREAFRSGLLDTLRAGLAELGDQAPARALAFLTALAAQAAEVPAQDDEGMHGPTPLTLVARALHGLLDPGSAPVDVARAWIRLLEAATDREADAEADGVLDENEARDLWPDVAERIRQAYGRVEGDFARLMNGQSEPASRRLLQLAFNRAHSHPQVLIVQSVVGREGLNLHEACRTVVLLHAEWNPGVVEQQIGRVDRIGSLWAKQLAQAVNEGVRGAALPRIHIRPVIFEGTYDELNWKILRERWNDLRAQLHGIVITPAVSHGVDPALARQINGLAPHFSPSRPRQRPAHRGGAAPTAAPATTTQAPDATVHRDSA